MEKIKRKYVNEKIVDVDGEENQLSELKRKGSVRVRRPFAHDECVASSNPVGEKRHSRLRFWIRWKILDYFATSSNG